MLLSFTTFGYGLRLLPQISRMNRIFYFHLYATCVITLSSFTLQQKARQISLKIAVEGFGVGVV